MEQTCRSWRGREDSDRTSHRGIALVWLLPANPRANGDANVPNLLHCRQMSGLPAPSLEITTLVLGMAILLLDTFASKLDKKVIAYIGISGLVLVFVATFFLAPSPLATEANGLWHFYTADALSVFFKRFALITTAVVIVMMIDYSRAVPDPAGEASHLGEFFALPVLTCAGLMYLVSAIDFIFIFVA